MAVIAMLAELFQAEQTNEQRRYNNWLREDYARSMGFKQFCFTDALGRDKWRDVHALHSRSATSKA